MSISLQLFNSKVRVDNYNNDFLILKPELNSEIRKIGNAIFQKKFTFAEEVIVTEVEICIKLNAHFDPAKIELLQSIEQTENTIAKMYRLPVCFSEHEDWKAVEATTRLNKKEIISKLLATHFSVAMFGFLPGFIYLEGLDESLHIPRKKIPSKYVKANSIALGGKYLGLYSLDSPGGWYVIGQMPILISQIPKLPPVVLNPGDRIRLQQIEKREYERLLQKPISLIEYNA